ncbi:biotin/lipoyl-binding protein [Vreelandella andesensis]|uniref:Biotin/lipoyl-binding protein n=1 Tax=Vreelandella andesensis TaxID=447567 RepID=A0A3S1DTW2_9GAMM|nr:biotin/lipoyl-binding protein [Halomonas andesensis]RUR34036.1 biotin/lipoyl-binding protein [Halomonas andesensis]
MTKRRLLILAVLAIIAIAISVVFWRTYSTPVPRLQGQIEARQYMVSSKVPGRLAEVEFRRGDSVNVGDVVFRIDSPELEAKLTQVDALDTISRSLAQAVEGGTREEKIAAARSEYQKAQAAESMARTTYERTRVLAEQGVVARQRLDEAFTLLRVAEQTRITAGELLRLADAGPREEARSASRAGEDITASLRDEINELLEDSLAIAPHKGIVSNVLLNPGELVPQGFPVVMITDLDEAWALFNVREDLLQHFSQGSEFDLDVPALGQQARFKVSHIAALGDFATWRATVPGRGFDMRTFEIEMQPIEPISGLRAGMSVLLALPSEDAQSGSQHGAE